MFLPDIPAKLIVSSSGTKSKNVASLPKQLVDSGSKQVVGNFC